MEPFPRTSANLHSLYSHSGESTLRDRIRRLGGRLTFGVEFEFLLRYQSVPSPEDDVEMTYAELNAQAEGDNGSLDDAKPMIEGINAAGTVVLTPQPSDLGRQEVLMVSELVRKLRRYADVPAVSDMSKLAYSYGKNMIGELACNPTEAEEFFRLQNDCRDYEKARQLAAEEGNDLRDIFSAWRDDVGRKFLFWEVGGDMSIRDPDGPPPEPRARRQQESWAAPDFDDVSAAEPSEDKPRWRSFGMEVSTATLAPIPWGFRQIRATCGALREHFHVHINSSCGLHVHVGPPARLDWPTWPRWRRRDRMVTAADVELARANDAGRSAFTLAELQKVATLFVLAEPHFMPAMLPPHRRPTQGLLDAAAPVGEYSMAACMAAWWASEAGDAAARARWGRAQMFGEPTDVRTMWAFWRDRVFTAPPPPPGAGGSSWTPDHYFDPRKPAPAGFEAHVPVAELLALHEARAGGAGPSAEALEAAAAEEEDARRLSQLSVQEVMRRAARWERARQDSGRMSDDAGAGGSANMAHPAGPEPVYEHPSLTLGTLRAFWHAQSIDSLDRLVEDTNRERLGLSFLHVVRARPVTDDEAGPAAASPSPSSSTSEGPLPPGPPYSTSGGPLGTVEVRYQAGTLDGDVAAAWTRFCAAMVAFALAAEPDEFRALAARMVVDEQFDAFALMDAVGLHEQDVAFWRGRAALWRRDNGAEQRADNRAEAWWDDGNGRPDEEGGGQKYSRPHWRWKMLGPGNCDPNGRWCGPDLEQAEQIFPVPKEFEQKRKVRRWTARRYNQ